MFEKMTPKVPVPKHIRTILSSIRKAFREQSVTKFDKKNARKMIRRVMHNWRHIFDGLLPLGEIVGGNKVDLYTDGDDVFFAMKEAIENAQSSVWLETYIYKADRIGLMIQEALIKAAQRGCEVILICDHIGTPYLPQSFTASLKQAGVKLLTYNSIWPWRRKGPLLFRDHRKILVIDELIGFCGGMNVSEDYAGKKWGNGRFYDAHIKIDGPAVRQLSELFLHSLGETTGEERKAIYPGFEHADGIYAQVLGSNRRRNLRAIQKSMSVVLSRATDYCYLMTPYFLPYPPLTKELIEAAKRGVRVKILTAGLSDVFLMHQASQHIYGQFLEAGIQIYEMFDKNMHAKTAAIDGVYGSVGSFNLDYWSARRNLEVTASFFSPHVAKELEHRFVDNLAQAKEVTLSTWKKRNIAQRAFQWVAYQIMRL